jgi:cell division protein FtsI (penicillin-binding protein 3)
LATQRLRIFARICLGWSLLIVLRLIQLQIIEHEDYAHQAEQQQQREVEIQAARGAILDRNGSALAMSVSVDSVCINPLRVPDLEVAAELLSKILNVDEGALLARMAVAAQNKRGFLWVKRKITPEEARKLRSYKLEWVEFRTESSRYYPKGSLAAHLLGGVDHEERGNAGIEHSLNSDLQGKPGIMTTTADVKRNVFDLKVFTDPQPGSDITLTVDERIQYVAEQELGKAVREHGASTGSLVVMDPKNGDVLALANYPTYDPNVPPKSKQDFEGRKNLGITAPFEPGSVFKVITIAAGLETTRLTPDSTFHCGNGAFTLFRRVIRDAKPHGVLSVSDILAKSSNIGSIKVGLQVGNQRLYEYIRAFGFGQKTGLPIPGESGGVVRRPERWIPSSIGSIAMGHELSTTTMQLARACSVVANGGALVKPRLVIAKNGERIPAEGEVKRVLKPQTAIKMQLMMRRVVEQGTGKGARLRGYSAGGKTGSAQIYDYAAKVYTHRYNGSFMGFAPARNPAIVVVVTLNNTRSGTRGFGGIVAAPVFAKVASAALRVLDVPKDMPDEEITDDDQLVDPDLAVADLSIPPELEAEEPAEAVVQTAAIRPELPPSMVPTGPKAPDFRGKTMRAVLAESAEQGIRIEIAGSGIARAQAPAPGAVLRPGERVRVVFVR